MAHLHQLYSGPLSPIAWHAAHRGWDCKRNDRGDLSITTEDSLVLVGLEHTDEFDPSEPAAPKHSAAVFRICLIKRVELSLEAVIAATAATEELRVGSVRIVPAAVRDSHASGAELVAFEAIHRVDVQSLDRDDLPTLITQLAESGARVKALLASHLEVDEASNSADRGFTVTLTFDESVLCDPKMKAELPRPPKSRVPDETPAPAGIFNPVLPASKRLLPEGLQHLLMRAAIVADESPEMDGINPLALARVIATKERHSFNQVFGPDAHEWVMKAHDKDLLTDGHDRTVDMLRRVHDRYDPALVYVGVVSRALEATFPGLAATIGLLRWQAGQKATQTTQTDTQGTKTKRAPKKKANSATPAVTPKPAPTLAELSKALKKRVQGQGQVIDSISSRLVMARRGLADSSKNRPEGVFLFAGPTGVGKTELAMGLADELFGGDGQPGTMIRLDMSEYHRDWAVSRLIGPNPGYHGSSEPAGWLTTRIAANPACVLLLDEFEKAHHEVWQLFLQVFDEGRLTDGRGNTVDFTQTVIVMTSNLGSQAFTTKDIGFAATSEVDIDSLATEREASVMREVRKALPPELFNRIDGAHVFSALSLDRITSIARSNLISTKRDLKRSGFDLRFDSNVAALIAEADYDPSLGARPLMRSINRLVREPLIALEAGQYAVSVKGKSLKFEPLQPALAGRVGARARR